MTAWTEQTLGALVAKMRPAPEYATIAHVGDGTGTLRNRTVDLVTVATWPSRGLTIEAFEIKTNRADWRREKKNPEKAEAIARHCDSFSIVAPAGVVPLEELPTDWGLYEAPKEPGTKGKLTCAREPFVRPASPTVDRVFLAALLQRTTKDVVPREDVARQAAAMAEARYQLWIDGQKSPELDRLQRKLDEHEKAIADFAERTGLPITSPWELEAAARAILIATRHGKDPRNLAEMIDAHRGALASTLEKLEQVAEGLRTTGATS